MMGGETKNLVHIKSPMHAKDKVLGPNSQKLTINLSKTKACFYIENYT